MARYPHLRDPHRPVMRTFDIEAQPPPEPVSDLSPELVVLFLAFAAVALLAHCFY